MDYPIIGFIGGGNMAASLIGGLVADGWDAARIHVSDPDGERLGNLQARFGVQTHADNPAIVEQAAAVVLAVKPQVLHSVVTPLATSAARQRPLFLSIAAGVRIGDIEAWLGGQPAIVRAMPNTPALVQSGATGLYANTAVDEAQRELAETILRAVGLTLWLSDEADLDAVTALSGSGPAYFFYVMECLEQAGIDLGLTPQSARLLTVQTAFGAAKMALESSEAAAGLRARVTSPGGTTEKALEVLQSAELCEHFATALRAAQRRAQELGDLLGDT